MEINDSLLFGFINKGLRAERKTLGGSAPSGRGGAGRLTKIDAVPTSARRASLSKATYE